MLSKAGLSAALVLLAASVASALPLATPLDDPTSFADLERRAEFDTIPTGVSLIDYFPRFTSPTSSSVFQAGGNIEISWNNTRPDYPDEQLHKSALVILGYLDDADPSGGYHLDFQNPLGNVSFFSGSGSASLPLPANLKTRSTYLLTMGSTRNISPLFTIEATSAASATSAGSSSSSSSSASAAASSSASPQIGSKPLTVYFPDGSTTVIGATTTASSSSSSAASASAAAEPNTSLNDIAAAAATSSSSAANVAASSAASASAAAGTLAQASVASSAAPSASSTQTSSALFGHSHGGNAGLALGAITALVLAF
ncbi:hypothetical protein JCM8115_001787 [Rhodotorula mucilaginosa]